MSDSYGDVTGEYFALRDDVGAVAGVHSLIWVRGKDAVSFLDGLLSQDIAAMDSQSVAKALLLTPQGKLRATLTLLRDDEAVGLICDAGRVDVVLEDLARFKFRVAADIDLFDGPVFDLIGPNAAPALDSAGLGPPAGWSVHDEVVVANVPLGSIPRYVVAGAVEMGTVARMAGRLAFDAVRIETGEPVVGRDIDEKTIPQEADVVDASVSFTKGCYLGQELVARIDSRGRVNRHLRGVVVATNVVPPLGASLVFHGKTVGELTSVAESLAVRAPIGLALVRREVEPGTKVTIEWDGGSVAGEVRLLPLDDASIQT
ncbi:MAG: folate-binding protein YgfZ [Acidimicrobiia bacterium]|nr:folate-binding protein YgfZ [Acidimicrobiia bacterium]